MKISDISCLIISTVFHINVFCLDLETFHLEIASNEEVYSSCWEATILETGLEFLANETVQLDIRRPLYGETVSVEDLVVDVGATLFHEFFNLEKMEETGWWERVRICVLLDNTKLCDEPSRMQGVRAEGLADGLHFLTAWATDSLGNNINCNSAAVSSLFYVNHPDPEYCVAGDTGTSSHGGKWKWVEILSPEQNSTVSAAQEVQVEMKVRTAGCTEGSGCGMVLAVQVDEGPILKHNLGVRVDGDFLYTIYLENLKDGIHSLDVWVEDNISKSKAGCTSKLQFYYRDENVCCPQDNRVIVTAANAPYFPRLENLIGSIHFWEPNTRIRIYDLGLESKDVEKICSWKNVEIQHMPYDTLPEHVQDARIVAFKSWVILNSLESFEDVLWLDANFELRRPLDEAWDILLRDGYFLTTCGRLFPTNINVRPQMLERYKCQLPPSSRLEYTTAVVGVRKNSWFHRSILQEMNRCCMEYACLWPPGTTFQNQRRDQSVLNAFLCNFDNVSIQSGMKWYMWADQVTFLPTVNETTFSEMVLFSRRASFPKPYTQYLSSSVTNDCKIHPQERSSLVYEL